MTIGPTLTTQRLILRPPSAEDFPAVVAFMADPVTKFIGGPQTPEMAWRGWATITGSWIINGFSFFSVIERDTGEWVGRVGPWQPLGWPGPEVGWGIVSAAQGKGYAKEAAIASVDWAFDNLGWEDVIHTIDPDNAPSIGVAQALGAANRGPGKLPAPLDEFRVDIWGQTRAQWKARGK